MKKMITAMFATVALLTYAQAGFSFGDMFDDMKEVAEAMTDDAKDSMDAMADGAEEISKSTERTYTCSQF